MRKVNERRKSTGCGRKTRKGKRVTGFVLFFSGHITKSTVALIEARSHILYFPSSDMTCYFLISRASGLKNLG